MLAVSAAQADRWVDFAQFDSSSQSSSLVLVREFGASTPAAPAPLASAVATRWRDGQAIALGAVQRWALVPGGQHGVRVGLGLGVDHFASRTPGDRQERSGASLRAQAEADGPLPGSRYYLLGQASSFRDNWFMTAQITLNAGPGVELSRYGDVSYHATTGVLRLPLDRLGARAWSLRLGMVRDDDGDRGLVGVGYNGF